MLEENLSKLGLSPSEIKIYIHLVKSGCSYPKQISADIKINRTNVYEALDRLISKGLVSHIIKNNIRWFEAEKPNSLIKIINEKKEQLASVKNQILKDFSKITMSNKPSLEARIFIGKKGLKLLFEDMLDAKKEISILASRMQLTKIFGPYFELWHKQRIKLGIKQRSIFQKKYQLKLKKRGLMNYKFVDDRYINPTTTIIYGGNCILIQWSDEPIAIKIENNEITKTHLNYFNLIWNSKH